MAPQTSVFRELSVHGVLVRIRVTNSLGERALKATEGRLQYYETARGPNIQVGISTPGNDVPRLMQQLLEVARDAGERFLGHPGTIDAARFSGFVNFRGKFIEDPEVEKLSETILEAMRSTFAPVSLASPPPPPPPLPELVAGGFAFPAAAEAGTFRRELDRSRQFFGANGPRTTSIKTFLAGLNRRLLESLLSTARTRLGPTDTQQVARVISQWERATDVEKAAAYNTLARA